MTTLWSYFQVFTTQISSKFFQNIPRKRVRINDHLTYLDLTKEIDNLERSYTVVFVRGGFMWHGPEVPSYIVPFYHFLSTKFYLVVPELVRPTCNLQIEEELDLVIERVKNEFGKPVILLGLSMGGVHVINYFYHHSDSCIHYITACSPLDLYQLCNVISSDSFYQLVVMATMKKLGISSYPELFRLAALEENEFEKQIENFSKIVKDISSWEEERKSKLVSFIASDDVLTYTFMNDRQYYSFPSKVYLIENSAHCCYRISISLAKYLNKLSL